MTEAGYNHHVAVWWSERMRPTTAWDEVCIYAIEHYGLPGTRYITDISADRMVWSFQDPKDALMFKLRWSEVAV